MVTLVQALKKIYYGSTIGALRGPAALYKQAKKQGVKGVTLEKCRKFLATQPVYSRHRPARVNYPRNPVTANIPGHVVQVDIMDLRRFEEFNTSGYVLLSYDTFSKFLSGYPLANRKPETVEAGLAALMDASPFPWASIYWDKEGAFLSRRVQAFLKQRNVYNYTTKSVVKAPGVERAIRTLRTHLQRHFDATGSVKWGTALPKIIANYNKRVHSTTKQVPNELARDPSLPVPPPKPPPKRKYKLPSVGDNVRLNRLRGLFEKEASDTWTEEVFRVVRVKTSTPIPLVYVEDMAGDKVLGGLYPEEYQVVVWDGKKRQDKVLKQRKLQGQPRQYFVSFKGWPQKFNTWVYKA